MNREQPSWHVALGNPEPHLAQLREVAALGSDERWTLNGQAQPGDGVVFYLTAPLSAFVGTGVVWSMPRKERNPRATWRGHYMADIRAVQLLSTPLPLKSAASLMPDWGWLRFPRRSTTVPTGTVPTLVSILGLEEARFRPGTEPSDLEGIATESVVLRRRRSERLRQQALERAKGICEVCGRDFSEVLNGRGVRVLQVHHRKQLASSDKPRVTRLSDLAVVCANCHLLIHLNPLQALSPESLKVLLAD